MTAPSDHKPVAEPVADPVAGEKQHIFDKPKNVRNLLRVFYVICLALIVGDFFVHRHIEHPLEETFGFYGLYGFIACVLLVLVATEMRKVLMRKEDYYQDDR